MARDTYSNADILTTVFDGYDDGSGVVSPLGTVAYIDGSSVPSPVTLVNGLPVQPQTGSTWAVTGTFWQATQPVSIAGTVAVSLASVPSHAVTNAGTFAVQVTSAPTTTVSGTVAIDLPRTDYNTTFGFLPVGGWDSGAGEWVGLPIQDGKVSVAITENIGAIIKGGSTGNNIDDGATTPAADSRGLVVREAAAPWGLLTATVTATSAANTVVKASPGRLCRAVVTTAGAGAGSVLIYDNATTNSGTIIGAIPATVAAGTTYEFEMPAAAGVTVRGVASGPVFTVSYR